MKKEDKKGCEINKPEQLDTELSPSKRELLKKAWVAPAVVTLASLPLGQVESGTPAPP